MMERDKKPQVVIRRRDGIEKRIEESPIQVAEPSSCNYGHEIHPKKPDDKEVNLGPDFLQDYKSLL